MNLKRTRLLKKGGSRNGPVVYWMSRDQRALDNWAMTFASELSDRTGAPFYVLFCLVPDFLSAGLQQFDFMLQGLEETEKLLKQKNIPFFLLTGKPQDRIPDFIEKHSVSTLVTDFDPLKIKKHWKDRISSRINIDFFEVDAHNIIPCWELSTRQEYAAYTIRPKIKKMLGEFLEDFPVISTANKNRGSSTADFLARNTDWNKIRNGLKLDKNAPETNCLKPGYKNSIKTLDVFLKNKIYEYDAGRNDPNRDAQSGLSPYLHFGQISAQRVVLELLKLGIKEDFLEPFLEEMVVRRELSDNYCFYNRNYDSFDGFPDWAKNTLNLHRSDKRLYIYNLGQFEDAETHDELWNSAQKEMVKTGKMHGYMRMYWAKKILEWTEYPEEAVEYAIYFNDKYELDGRDPNGYTGISWSIGGLHDRAWSEREIFGKIRYMSYEGCRRKFDIRSYINKINHL